jgi:hypothetical protein
VGIMESGGCNQQFKVVDLYGMNREEGVYGPKIFNNN